MFTKNHRKFPQPKEGDITVKIDLTIKDFSHDNKTKKGRCAEQRKNIKSARIKHQAAYKGRAIRKAPEDEIYTSH